MSNAKKPYSEASAEYIQNRVPIFDIDRKRYERSKRKEAEFNENWMKQKVNLNKLVDRYAPKAKPKDHGTKMEWNGPVATVIADKISGSVRICLNNTKTYLDINGIPSRDQSKTHFKIKRPEEM